MIIQIWSILETGSARGLTRFSLKRFSSGNDAGRIVSTCPQEVETEVSCGLTGLLTAVGLIPADRQTDMNVKSHSVPFFTVHNPLVIPELEQLGNTRQ